MGVANQEKCGSTMRHTGVQQYTEIELTLLRENYKRQLHSQDQTTYNGYYAARRYNSIMILKIRVKSFINNLSLVGTEKANNFNLRWDSLASGSTIGTPSCTSYFHCVSSMDSIIIVLYDLSIDNDSIKKLHRCTY